MKDKDINDYFEAFFKDFDEVAAGRLSSDYYDFAFYYRDEENGQLQINAIAVLLFPDEFKLFRECRRKDPADKEYEEPLWHVYGYRNYGEFGISENATAENFNDIEKIITCEKTKLQITEI